MHKAGIRDVAREAGVSISTVSRAFTKPQLVSQATRDRVMAAANKLDFNISRSAMALKSGQTYRVALLMSEGITSWFNAEVFAGIDDVMHGKGYDISLYQHINDAETRDRFFTVLPVLRNVDAVFVASFAIEPAVASYEGADRRHQHARPAPFRRLRDHRRRRRHVPGGSAYDQTRA